MEINEIVNELKQIKEDIDDAKQEKAETEGRLTEQMKTLKSFGVSSIAEAQKKVTQLGRQIEKLEITIAEDYEELQGAYSW